MSAIALMAAPQLPSVARAEARRARQNGSTERSALADANSASSAEQPVTAVSAMVAAGATVVEVFHARGDGFCPPSQYDLFRESGACVCVHTVSKRCVALRGFQAMASLSQPRLDPRRHAIQHSV